MPSLKKSTKGNNNVDTTINTSLESAEGKKYCTSYEEYEAYKVEYPDAVDGGLNVITDKILLTLSSSNPTKLGTATGKKVGTVTITLNGSS